MVGTRRKRSPGKDDTSKRRKTGEQANRTDTATLKNPMTSTLEQDQSADAARQSPSEDGFDNAIARFMANWEHIAPSKPLAGSISKKSGSLNDSASKSVRFAPTSENPPEDTGNGDQEQVNNQLLWESQTPIMSGANGEDGRPHAELTNTSESSPESASGVRILPLRRTRLPNQVFKPHPMLPRTDNEFEEVLVLIKNNAWRWAFKYFNNVSTDEARKFDLYQLAKQSPQLMEYANWIALGGDKWEDIFNEKRASLVFGILGKMLEVHVFGHEMFGATPGQFEALLATEKEMVHVDGFARQRVRASTIRGLLGTSVVPPNFDTQVRFLTLSFYTMIRPLIAQAPTATSAPTSPVADLHISSPGKYPAVPSTRRSSSAATATSAPFPPRHAALISSLYHIITRTAKVSLNMRREPATIYHISSPAKNSPFPLESSPSSSFTADFDELHCLNSKHLRHAGLYVEDTACALVTMVCFPGIVAYRPGNGREGGEEDGYRTRRICTAEVVVGWANRARQVERVKGKQRAEEDHRGGKNWTWGKGDWDVSLREAVEIRKKAGKRVSPLLVAGGFAGAAGVVVAGYMQAQAMGMVR